MNPIRLSDLAFTIEAVIDEAFGQRALWVVAETSDIKNYPDRGYCFLTLIEREAGRETLAKLDACIWRKHHHTIRDFESETGVAFARNIQLLLLVSVGFSPVYGLRVEILKIDPSYTLGNLERERQAVLDKLVQDHPDRVWLEAGQYITANQLLPRPTVIQRLALISAPGSDGWRDFRHELTQNAYGYAFQVDEYLTQVQGTGAERAICGQLERIQQSEIPYDAVVIVRGGGSQLDFGSFDTFLMGYTVAGFTIPILAGIGHERNVSLTDMLCHESVKTPTKAAAFLIDHNRQFEESCLQLRDRIGMATRDAMQTAREKLDSETERLRFVMHNYFRDRHTDLTEKAVTLRHLDPANVLRRGYALLLQEGRILTSVAAVKPDKTLQVQLRDGTITVISQGVGESVASA
ncbi:exodeoxyribonuclease VII large subunit [Spirosoma utsteinense]|uniref:Exodeoxyribonuclease VII large subunit n=1 Tax=Spirosoma utsteinense TaxID=2585773 RepID=A0ABR6W1V7_9BACT|nr:exodeoxyribonuclease VII large subunit [Spirosoma utsteinense]MBC3785206.1 exodeoxyribonuclease VII large subunit [Spirosoma utsteinense]MBC3790569.1 exodeoxyribonuclease VII large subunit [Spirosoma utsteinense]